MCACPPTRTPPVSRSRGLAGIAPRPAGRGAVLAGGGAAAGHVVPGPAPRRAAAWRSVSVFAGSGTGADIGPAAGACGQPVGEDTEVGVGLQGEAWRPQRLGGRRRPGLPVLGVRRAPMEPWSERGATWEPGAARRGAGVGPGAGAPRSRVLRGRVGVAGTHGAPSVGTERRRGGGVCAPALSPAAASLRPRVFTSLGRFLLDRFLKDGVSRKRPLWMSSVASPGQVQLKGWDPMAEHKGFVV